MQWIYFPKGMQTGIKIIKITRELIHTLYMALLREVLGISLKETPTGGNIF